MDSGGCFFADAFDGGHLIFVIFMHHQGQIPAVIKDHIGTPVIRAEDGLIGQVAVWHAPLELALEVARHIQQHVQFRVGPFLGGDPVSSLEEGFHCVFS